MGAQGRLSSFDEYVDAGALTGGVVQQQLTVDYGTRQPRLRRRPRPDPDGQRSSITHPTESYTPSPWGVVDG